MDLLRFDFRREVTFVVTTQKEAEEIKHFPQPRWALDAERGCGVDRGRGMLADEEHISVRSMSNICCE